MKLAPLIVSALAIGGLFGGGYALRDATDSTAHPSAQIAHELDSRRLADLVTVSDRLTAYAIEHHSYPSTVPAGDQAPQVQTLCVYREDDVGCQFADGVPGDAVWYASDGLSYTLWSDRAGDEAACPGEAPAHLAGLRLMCITGRLIP